MKFYMSYDLGLVVDLMGSDVTRFFRLGIVIAGGIIFQKSEHPKHIKDNIMLKRCALRSWD